MGKNNELRCPGCSKKCAMGCEGCKYGRRYFEKMSAEKDGHKWERYAPKGSGGYQLLEAAWLVKKALKKGYVSENELFGVLNEEEQVQMSAVLGKLSACAQSALPAKKSH